MNTRQFFRASLFEWFGQNHRPMPWKGERDPYKIWLSEIILQQTRVEQGLPYYQRFVSKYPDVHTLADAPEDEVLKLWEGLGYYSRARNLHAAAQVISRKMAGKFPDTFESIRALKGVGDYTAAAIASFAFDLPHAVLDGNVYRVLARYFGIETPIDTATAKKEFALLSQQLLDPARPGDFNQALMDFGATHCTPQQPKCANCPLESHCVAFQTNKVPGLPVKSKTLIKKDRFFIYLIVHYKGATFVRKRTGKDIWQNLWEFPMIELPVFPADHRQLETLVWQQFAPQKTTGQIQSPTKAGEDTPSPARPYGASVATISKPYRQMLTHRIVTAVFCDLNFPDDTPPEVFEIQLFENCRQITRTELKKNIAVPRVIDRFLQESVLTLTLI